MSTSINCEVNDKLCKEDAPIFYRALEELHIKFTYLDSDSDYNCPIIPHEDLPRLIDSGKLETEDGVLLSQVQEIYDAGDDLQLVH